MITAVRNDSVNSLVFQSRKILSVVEQIRRFASSDAVVLITGESGTGKEMVARLLHEMSPRREQPYVRINCAALAAGVVESELFGHERGAFSGATSARAGRFEQAQGGTLLLDEISETPCAIQPRLLRVLEATELQRLGGTRNIPLDVRVIATSNRHLESEVAAGEFRSDLYYRLNILRIALPPLRERPEDIPVLATHFVQQFANESSQQVERISARGMRALCDYDWPGNVRQLRNVIHRACVMASQGVLESVDFEPLDATSPDTVADVAFDSMRLEEVERHVILQRLQLCNGNNTAAATALGVSARTLTNKMKTYRELGYI